MRDFFLTYGQEYDPLQKSLKIQLLFSHQTFPQLSDALAIRTALYIAAAELAGFTAEEFQRKFKAATMRVSFDTDVTGTKCFIVTLDETDFHDFLNLSLDYQQPQEITDKQIRIAVNNLIDHLRIGGSPSPVHHTFYRGARIIMPSGLRWMDTTPQSRRS